MPSQLVNDLIPELRCVSLDRLIFRQCTHLAIAELVELIRPIQHCHLCGRAAVTSFILCDTEEHYDNRDTAPRLCTRCSRAHYYCELSEHFYLRANEFAEYEIGGRYRAACVVCINRSTVPFIRCEDCARYFQESIQSLEPYSSERDWDEDEDEDDREERNHVPGITTLCRNCRPRVINSYSYRPQPIFFADNRTLLITEGPVPVLWSGIELEVECRRYSDAITVAMPIAEMLKPFCYLKNDGSLVNGFEIVSHPASLEYWQDPGNILISNLGKIGRTCASYSQENCGIHIHLSKDAFEEVGLWRFLSFLYNNQSFCERIAERSSSFARFTETERTDLISRAKLKAGNYDRYVAANLQNDATIELRIFKGNLNPQKVLKDIEFCYALHQYSDPLGLDEVPVDRGERNQIFQDTINEDTFLRFIRNNADRYPNLAKTTEKW